MIFQSRIDIPPTSDEKNSANAWQCPRLCFRKAQMRGNVPACVFERKCVAVFSKAQMRGNVPACVFENPQMRVAMSPPVFSKSANAWQCPRLCVFEKLFSKS
jgi:hypothetical protein